MATSVEAPSGKDANYENFPVGSFLLPSHLRPHIAVFYHFARAIDDIADAYDLDASVKVLRLEGFEKALRGENADDDAFETGHAMRRSLLATNVTIDHGLALIDAFKQDTWKNRYADWSELMSYCDRSAAPVGRYLVDLHGGFHAHHSGGYESPDALCNALQVINHLQDAKEDYLEINRVYLPADWMAEAGASVEDLSKTSISPAMRRVYNRCLDGTEALLRTSAALPPGLVSRRLACESAAIIEIAWKLTHALRYRDPLSAKVKLGKTGYLLSCITGVVRELSGMRRT